MGKFRLVNRMDYIKDACAGKKTLHLGCTNHPYTKEAIENNMLLHFELEKAASELFGFDYDSEGIATLAEYGTKNLYQADLEKLEEVSLEEKFDVIIAGEMIEHLSNPGLFLNGVKRFMHSGTSLIITTINAYGGLRFFLYGLRGKGGEAEFVHPDHVAYYSYSTLKLTIERQGLTLTDFAFYGLGPEHRPHNPWYYNLCSDICTRFAPQLGDGVVADVRLGKG